MKSKKHWWILLFIICILVGNTGSIFYLVTNCISISDKDAFDISYFDLITNKFIAKSIYGDDYLDYYRFWHKPVIYFAIFIGWILTGIMLWSLIKHSSLLAIENKKILANEKIANENREMMKELINQVSNKDIKKLNREKKEREKYIRGRY